MAGGTLTPGAVSGKNILFTSSTSVFFTSDVGRLIIFGASRAIIISFGASVGDTTSPNTNVRADILDVFPDTNPIPSGLWLLRLSPQSALDPDKKEPIGATITLVADKPTFRAQDMGKFIVIYGGLVKITSITSVTEVKGEILSLLQVTATDPPASPAGAWTLEEASWSEKYGFPRTGEFYQGRLGQAATIAQPTTFWLSQSDAYDKYAIGIKASDAIDYTVASRQLNRIEWLGDNQDLILGTSGLELSVKSGKTDNEPLGGDVIPRVDRSTTYGSAPIQPIIIGGRLLFVDRSLRQVFSQSFDFASNAYTTEEVTAIAEHITKPGIRLGPIAFQKRLDSRLFFVRKDGTLLALTYFLNQKVVGFTRFTTQGLFEAVACIPQAAGKPDQVWVIVSRTVGGNTKRYVELFDEEHENLTARAWKSLQTDCSVVYTGASTTVVVGLDHLEGMTVDVIADGGYRGTAVVAGGQITLIEAASEVEVGLHYNSKVVTMRPAVENTIIEGIPRSWDKVFTRLVDSMGGHVNNEPIQYPASLTGALELFTGDREVTGQGWNTEGRLTVEQRLPYPFTLLALFGTLSVGDND